MRLPRPAQYGGFLALACALVSLVLVTPGAPATGGGGGDDLEEVEAKLALCRKDLEQARGAVNATEDLLALARKRPFVLLPVPGFGGIVPVSVKSVTDALILQYVTGEITRAQLVRQLQNLTRQARATAQLLTAAIDEAREGVDRTQKRCAALAEQRNRLKAGGGAGGGGGGTGAYPGGTATTMTLTIEGHVGTLDLKTSKTTYTGNTSDVPGTKRGTVSGSVRINGTLPAGWNTYVFDGAKTAHTGPGAFTIKDPIGSQRRVGATAQICASPPAATQPCVTGNSKALLTVFWTWVP